MTKYQNGLGIDNKLKMIKSGTTKYFLADHLGSTTALTDTGGNISSFASYDSFGNQTGNLNTRYAYTGREFDSFTGLYYNRARFYDAKLGRFISEDPIGFVGGINLFAYSKNDPLFYKDPMGHNPCVASWATAGAVAGGVIGGGVGLVRVVGGGVAVVVTEPAGLALGAAAGGLAGAALGSLLCDPTPFARITPGFPTAPKTECNTKPKSNPAPAPNGNPGPASLPAPSNTSRPFTPPSEPKRKCEFTSSFDNPATNKKHCIYRCQGGGFPGSYNIVTRVEIEKPCPEPDKSDNDWVPGGS